MLSRALPIGAATLCLALSSGDTPTAPCCFENPRYSGTCEVEPAEGETCASILEYLNNPMAQGKSYCGGTDVRQGWTEVSCKEKETPSESR
jgi:hypothetical protein